MDVPAAYLPAWALLAKAAPGRRTMRWRENLASVEESSSSAQLQAQKELSIRVLLSRGALPRKLIPCILAAEGIL